MNTYGVNGNAEYNSDEVKPLAVILGFWESIEAYRNFMLTIHDDIFSSNAQAGSYDPALSSVTLWSDDVASYGSSENQADSTTTMKQITEVVSQASSFSIGFVDDADLIPRCENNSTMLLFNPLDNHERTALRLVISTIPTANGISINIEPEWRVA